MKDKLLVQLRRPTMFALVFQGINGLIQVEAFFALRGAAYLAFSVAYLAGTVLSLLVVLNFENLILAGQWTRSVRGYLAGNWLLGMSASVASWALQSTVPSFVAFCCFGVCSRLFLAWANQARPAPAGPLCAGGAVLASCLLGDLNLVLVVAMLAFPVAAWRAQRPAALADSGFWAVLRNSAGAFARYLPHTLSGLAVGYLDRYVALDIVGGTAAEGYLRTVQVCSWAAFVAYPVVFQARSRVLQAGRLEGPLLGRSVSLLAAAITGATAIILLVAWIGHRMPPLSAPVLVLVLMAIVCSQSYQVVSTLNFVGNRFGTVNRITLSSAAVVVVLAFTVVPTWKTAESLSLVLFAGWFVQLGLTTAVLRRR
jgi:hypothetical protein